MKPATRFLIVGMLLVIVVAAAAASGVVWQTQRVAEAKSLHQLRLTGTVEGELQTNRLQELQLRAEVLARDPAFTDYVTQSLIPDPKLGGAVDSASISDLLAERRHGYDIAMVLDPHGKPVALSGILLKSHASIQSDPLVTSALASHQPTAGVWVDHGQLFWVAVNPLLRSAAVQGVLVAATRVDDAFAIAVSRLAGTDVAFHVEHAPDVGPAPASMLDAWAAQALTKPWPKAFKVTEAAGQPLLLVGADHHRATAWVTPLATSGDRAVLVALDSTSSSGGWLNAAAKPLLLGVAVLTLLAALSVWLLWRGTWLPLQRIVDVVQLARNGDQHLTVRTGGSLIVRRLRDGINLLLRGTSS
ncbi:MAG: hypothetical protein ABI114_10125 [Rhodanobacter sp.]